MKPFIHDDFLLHTDAARSLFHQYAKNQPIIDYHCHISPKEIADDKQFDNLTQIWLYGDHYKWRAMRTNGIPEKYCTGDVADFEKFKMWAETVPYTMRNPLYHWTHLELNRYYGITELLSPATATKIYEEATAKLQTKEYSVRNLIRKMNVEVVCTTDDPIDTLEYHQKIKNDGFEVKVVPAWRPDKVLAVENPETFNEYIQKLEASANISIATADQLLEALRIRQDYFHENGCRLSDHGLDTIFAADFTHSEVNRIFQKVRNGHYLNAAEIQEYKSGILFELALLNQRKGWVQQFHIGAMRNNNLRMLKQLGPDTGFDSIGDLPIANSMSKLFGMLDAEDKLAKTIIYNLNPSDNEVYATMIGNYQDGSSAGKMQWGAAWWFLDQKRGMETHLETLSVLGLTSRFVGMLTDSRSFMSYPRHEYFRRILCNIYGNDIEKGELPNDIETIGKTIANISYGNARNYFGFWQ
jgi:glucuronate isomerase